MIPFVTLLSFVYIINLVFSIEYAPIVKIDSGEIRGLKIKLEDNSNVYLYKGIRYGQAKRFEKAKFADPWNGIYNATKIRDACPQPGKHINHLNCSDNGSSGPTISEDCLYLNIYKPESTPKMLLPVMFWIHGGSFISGSIFDNSYDARYMASMGKVIIVTINYRLGPFGFLYAGVEQAPGNQGSHDQILALQWVQKNIVHFGGDPNLVTAFGESAGSMSLGALVLSPLTKNLFQKAILQSGSPNAFLGSCNKKKGLEKTISFAQRLNCYKSSLNMSHIIECLRTKTIEQILYASKDDLINSRLMIPVYGEELMPISPVEALKTQQFTPIDLMFGVTRNEGSGFVNEYVPILNSNIKHPNITLRMVKTGIWLMMLMFQEPDKIAHKIAEFYTMGLNESNQDDLRNAVADAFGDYHLVCPTMLYGEYFSRVNTKNHYAYRLMLPLSNGPFSGKSWEGVLHGEDVAYLFIVPRNPIAYTKKEVQLSNDMIKAWTKFAWNGHPGSFGNQVEWKEAIDNVANSSVVFMALDSNKYQMIRNYFQMRDISEQMKR